MRGGGGEGGTDGRGALRLRWPALSSSLLGKGFDGHEAQTVAGGLVAVDDPTECKLAYLAVVSHPAAETVAHLIDKFLQRRFAQRLWFAWLRSRPHSGYVVAMLPGSVPPHPLSGGHRLSVLRVTSLAHVRNVAHSSSSSRSSGTRTRCSASRSRTSLSGSGNRPSKAARTGRWMVPTNLASHPSCRINTNGLPEWIRPAGSTKAKHPNSTLESDASTPNAKSLDQQQDRRRLIDY